MDEEFIGNRITELRLQKNLSEREISLALGHSSSYIHSIANGKGLPSMREFLALCEYFNIEPHEFFDARNTNPVKRRDAIDTINGISDEDLSVLLPLLKRFAQKASNNRII